MKKFFITFVSAFAVLVIVSAVSCSRQKEQEPREPNQAIIDLCISNMTDLVGELKAVGTQMRMCMAMGTLAPQDIESQAKVLVDKLSVETKSVLTEIGWEKKDFDEMDEVVGIEEAYAWFATLLVTEYGGFSDGTTPIDGGINDPQMVLTWKEVGACAILAIGADFTTGLGASGLASWGIAAIKTAFKVAARSLLGPLGVAIAVVTFTTCIIASAVD